MKITMGNDEFILYIRKQYPACTTPNPALGRQIWAWLEQADPDAEQLQISSAYWGEAGDFVAITKLPERATQFSFDREVLPRLYTYLDTLGAGKA